MEPDMSSRMFTAVLTAFRSVRFSKTRRFQVARRAMFGTDSFAPDVAVRVEARVRV